jgi:hypothetical protein
VGESRKKGGAETEGRKQWEYNTIIKLKRIKGNGKIHRDGSQ